uniref:Reverse transcriptase domain-containing protein n=1 Tax=Pygocentrus nattereri TaxID=42514 RepID=A0AAR2KZX5_PYGNA
MHFSIPVLVSQSHTRRNHYWRKRETSNLTYPPLVTHGPIVVAGGLWNCQSAVQKVDYITSLASSQSLDFLALTETWITPENSATPAALSSAFSFSHSARRIGRGGGTGLLLSKHWRFTPLSFPQLVISTFEFHAVTVYFPSKFHILVVYCPPSALGHFIEELDTLLYLFPVGETPLILLGDFNLPLEKLQSSYLLPLLSSFDLTLNQSPPTHRAGNVLDLVFTRPTSATDLVVTPLTCSDHYFLSFSLSLPTFPTSSHTTTTCRNLHSISPSNLASCITSTLPSPDSFSSLSVESATDTLLSSISSSLDHLCPVSSRPLRSSPPAPWLTEALRIDRRALRLAEKRWKKSRLTADLLSYQTLLSKFSKEVTAAKSSFYREKLEASAADPRKLFSIFSSLLNPPPPPSPISLTANDFASFFKEKVNKICDSFSLTPTTVCHHSLSPKTLTCFSSLSNEEVHKLLISCNPTTCPLDPIPSTLLRSISHELLPFISSIINSSLSSGMVPSSFKAARVVPILKKPSLDGTDINNYRPVSLLSFLSKILERAVYNQLSVFLSKNQLQDPNQSGFKPAHSTETALIAVSEKLHAARSAGLSSVLILLDLSAAFDTVNHKILLSILSGLGISGTAWKWFESYLEGRCYQVTWRGSTSTPCNLSTGVPQCSVLGPLLFSLYTRSLGHVISSHGFSYHCYADDTQLILSFPPNDTQVSTRIAASLADVASWMTTHHLKLNPSKTEMLYIPGSSGIRCDLSIPFENTLITPSTEARSLGVVVDDQLSFMAHVANLTRSCRFLLYNIRRIRPFLSREATQVLVQSLVISRLDYCNSLLAGLPMRTIRPLQLIQNPAARLVFNLPKFSHVTPLLRSLHWLPVAARIRYKTLMLAYKAKNGPAPSYVRSMVKARSLPRDLRASSTARLDPPSCRSYEEWRSL